MKYGQVMDGEWVQPIVRGYKVKCCDCGLVHRIDIRISATGRVQFRTFRDERSTAQVRRHAKARGR